MRKLVLTRGIQGSGKSHFLRQEDGLGLVLSTDKIRLMMSSPRMNFEGGFSVAQNINKEVFAFLAGVAKSRMERGDTTFIDATFANARDFKPFLELARRFNYEVACLNFNTPLSLALKRNNLRPELFRVPESAIRKYAERIESSTIPGGVRVIPVDAESPEKARAQLNEFLDEMVFDFGAARRIIHIGDIHGCFSALREALLYVKPTKDDVVIFIGDYFDRGIENGETMRWLVDIGMRQWNFHFLRGNHESHLMRYVHDEEPVSAIFAKETLPQILAAGINKDDMREVYCGLRDILFYRAGDTRVMVTHAGISTAPRREALKTLSAKDCVNGVGNYGDDIDAIFSENMKAKEMCGEESWVQIHGHRNLGHHKTLDYKRSINLEGGVEAGGDLRLVVLEGEKWHPINIKNKVFEAREIESKDRFEKKRGHGANISHQPSEETSCQPPHKM